MPHRFVTQPIAGGFDLKDFVESACTDPDFDRIDFAVAWVKRAGLLGVQLALDGFRSRMGHVRGVVGISLGGTSSQGLLLAREVCDELYIFHEPGRTFHPKVYIACGGGRARTFVGSNNLTFGGLSYNYEAAVMSDLDLGDATDEAYLDSVTDFIEGLVGEEEICQEATAEFVSKLLADSRYPLFDEDAGTGTGEDPVEGGGALRYDESEGEVLFGAAKRPKRTGRRRPGPTGATRPAGRRRGAGTGTGRNAPPTAPDPVVKRWFKPLGRADAQQLGGNSSPSNTMTLVQGGHPIDRNTYFRVDFFDGETWTPATTRGGKARDVALIEAEVVVDSVSLGAVPLEVRHTPEYASEQGNRVTELGWRGFGTYLQLNPLNGRFATLEKLQSGRYRILIEDHAAGPFIR